ncbi:response regulator transcription factor [Demequina sediminicola]|uniref:response regulator transcription factor n=1 Tax=Demequina sediminicola TaxID=1095026 RepID=UPI000785F2FE|nr:LuxR C-terminal-related transcriptional regulator [Demequina sediminicola]
MAVGSATPRLDLSWRPRAHPAALPRPEVDAVLEARHPLTVVCAPFGYAKADAVEGWLTAEPERRDRSAWLSLRGVNAEALQQTLTALAADDRLSQLDTLVVSHLPHPSPEGADQAFAGIRELMDRTKCAIIVISTDSRSLPDHAVAAAGGVVINEDQLSVGRDQIVHALAATRGRTGADAVDALEIQRTAVGWPAAVALLSARTHSRDVLLSEVLDGYVDTELLSRLDAESLALLEATAAATWCDRSTLRRLTRASDEQFDALVDVVTRASLAAVRGHGASQRLRVIPAVRGTLVRRRQAVDPASLRAEHRAMLEMTDGALHPDVALYHAIEGEEWEAATVIFERNWSELFIDHAGLVAWALGALPARLRESRLGLMSGLEIALDMRTLALSSDSWPALNPEENFSRIHGQEEREQSRPVQPAQDMALYGLWRMLRARRIGNFDEARDSVAMAHAKVQAVSGERTIAASFAPIVFLQWGITSLFAFDLPRAREHFETSYTLGPASRVDFVPRNAAGCLALMSAIDGDVADAQAWLERARALRRPRGRWTRIAMVAENLALALVAVYQGRTADAVEHLEDPMSVAERDEFWAFTLYVQAIVAQSQGAPMALLDDIARQRLARADLMPESSFSYALVGLAEAEVRLSLGQPDRAQSVLSVLPPLPRVQALKAHVEYVLGDARAALDAATLVKWGSYGGPVARTHGAVVRLMCCLQLKEHDAAWESLSRADELIRAYALPCAWSMVDEQARAALGEDQWNRVAPGAPAPRYPSPLAERALSAREVAALRSVAGGLTVDEAAAELFVSANTVRSQLKAAYRKLGASSRSEAIAAAARRGLLH